MVVSVSGRPRVTGDAVELVAEPRLVAAGHQPGAGRAAIRARDVALREADAVPGDRVDVRRRDVLAALEAILGPADVVGEDDEDVGLAASAARASAGLTRKRSATASDGRNERSVLIGCDSTSGVGMRERRPFAG